MITLALRTHTAALVTLFTASTIMPAVLYASTVLLYVFVGRQRRSEEGRFSLGRWEVPVITGALIWLAYELIILIGPSVFRDAQYYALSALGLGVIFYLLMWLIEPGAMRSEQGRAAGPRSPPRRTRGLPRRTRCLAARREPLNVLAIDQGTSATKAVLVGPGQQVLGAYQVPVSVRAADRAGTGDLASRGQGVEADPEELLASVIEAGDAGAGCRPRPGARGGAGQPGRDGAGLGPADRAAAHPGDRLAGPALGRDMRAPGPAASAGFAQITGLPLDPYFAAPKMTWLRENLSTSGVVTTTDTWLLARLGGGYVTDAATASRTMLLDLDAADWSAEACAIFGVDPAGLPAVADCAGVTGETAAFGKPLPIAGLAVDQQAALLAEHCLTAGQAKCTYGTGAFLLVTTGAAAVRSAAGLSASVAWRLAGTPTYCLDGQVYTAGAAVSWLRETGLIASAADLDAVGGTVPDSGGAVFLPALAGLGAPHWRARCPRRFPAARPAHHQGAPGPRGGRRAGCLGSAAGLARWPATWAPRSLCCGPMAG